MVYKSGGRGITRCGGYMSIEPKGRQLIHTEGVTPDVVVEIPIHTHLEIKQRREGWTAEESERNQEFNRGNPSLKASSSQNGLCWIVSERTVAAPSPRFNQTHLYCLAIVTNGPHLGRSEFTGSSQTMSLFGWQLL